MCYSAQVYAELKKFTRATGIKLTAKDYIKLYWDQTKSPYAKRPKVPRAMEIEILNDGPEDLAEIIRGYDAREMAELEQELFKQKKRVADGQRALQAKTTKKAQDDVRIGTDKMGKIQVALDDLRRKESKDRDFRIYPGMHTSVIVSKGGKRIIRPMRYQCRPAGKPASYDRRYPGTYNARRDNLEGFWKGQFGYTHAVMVATRFYENVEGADGKNQILEFTPRDHEPMLIACLWSHWTDPKGQEPELFSFAAITDEPEPEVAAAGHDRTVINLKPEHLDAWLNPNPADLAALYAIFDDKRHPYYEHRKAA